MRSGFHKSTIVRNYKCKQVIKYLTWHSFLVVHYSKIQEIMFESLQYSHLQSEFLIMWSWSEIWLLDWHAGCQVVSYWSRSGSQGSCLDIMSVLCQYLGSLTVTVLFSQCMVTIFFFLYSKHLQAQMALISGMFILVGIYLPLLLSNPKEPAQLLILKHVLAV